MNYFVHDEFSPLKIQMILTSEYKKFTEVQKKIWCTFVNDIDVIDVNKVHQKISEFQISHMLHMI